MFQAASRIASILACRRAILGSAVVRVPAVDVDTVLLSLIAELSVIGAPPSSSCLLPERECQRKRLSSGVAVEPELVTWQRWRRASFGTTQGGFFVASRRASR